MNFELFDTGRTATASAQPDTIVGTVESVRFYSAENGYTVLSVQPSQGVDGEFTATGVFPVEVRKGECFRLTGTWVDHPRFGLQFKIENSLAERPVTDEGICSYLASGILPGVGPKLAERIVKHFGAETLTVLDDAPERLRQVRGLSKASIPKITEAWKELGAQREVMLFLQGHGITPGLAAKVFKEYGTEAISVVESDPYRLIQDIPGVGFHLADKIARSLGMPENSPRRIKAGIMHTLREANQSGHCFLPAVPLLDQATETLRLPGENVRQVVESQLEEMLTNLQLVEEKSLTLEDDPALRPVYLPSAWKVEQTVTGHIQRLLGNPLRVAIPPDIEEWFEAQETPLSDEQQASVIQAMKNRVMILTGGPGSGKTTTLKTVVALFSEMGKTVQLAAPTGRAAQRLAEVTGMDAMTIHRMLEFNPQGGFQRGMEYPLDGDVVIIDESSMIDLNLMLALMRAIGNGSQLLLVGDVDQLPSVGAGTVLRDLIDSGAVPTARLTRVYRQAAESDIISNARRVNAGEMPILTEPGNGQTDCYFLSEEDQETALQLLVKSVVSSLPRRFGYDPVQDIQVLSPMNRGTLGAINLNRQLQQVINPAQPGQPEIKRGEDVFRVGDKVIQRVNNYNLEVFNGDIGRIDAVGNNNTGVIVRYGDRYVAYDATGLPELGLAYCITIHKSQGAEYPAVVFPLHTSHYMMLSRNLFYTALTRAKKTAIIIGTRRAVGMAVSKLEVARRHTGLKERLQGKQ